MLITFAVVALTRDSEVDIEVRQRQAKTVLERDRKRGAGQLDQAQLITY